MGEKIENGTIHVGEIIGKTLDGKDIYKFTELGMAENVKIIAPQYKDGDFVYEDGRIMIVKSYPSNCHALVYPYLDGKAIYDRTYGVNFSEPTFRYATEEEKQILIDAMKKDSKRWNEEKKCIEDIPKRKFKAGDKVKIKDCISSKTHRGVSPGFVNAMDKFIGKELTVKEYSSRGWVVFYGDEYEFAEDWLEPYKELKKGDLAIFWDENKEYAKIGIYLHRGVYHYDHSNTSWTHAIKFESKEQFEKLIKGES